MILEIAGPQIKIIPNDLKWKIMCFGFLQSWCEYWNHNGFIYIFFQDAKVVTIFNMIAVPCFVYQGAVGLLGERLQYIIEE